MLTVVSYRSWRRAFLYSNDPESHADDNGHISAFLSSPESIELLDHSLSPFSRPSAKSKTELESRTAAIHVETTPKGSFDLQEIKADAQWLSQTAKIDEISALRITVLEWQNRPATRLTTNFSNEETSSIQSAAGADNLGVSVAGPNLASILRPTADTTVSSFNNEANRRLRLRSLYLSERSHLLKTCRKLLVLFFHDASSKSSSALPSGAESGWKATLSAIGATLFQKSCNGDGLAVFLEECMGAIRNRLQDLETSGGWLGAEESTEETENIWRTTLVEEVVHILQIMFHQLRASTDVASGKLLASWLDLMADFGFLESLQVVSIGFSSDKPACLQNIDFSNSLVSNPWKCCCLFRLLLR